jgi:tetratricopeptide (TPR) repeat protein
LSASDKITAADPQSISGPLKKEFAAMITMSVISVGLSSNERVRDCLAAAEQVFAKQPGHPYASDAASTCYVGAAEIARQHGEDPQHLLHKALQLMEPTIQRHSHFLWGINDLGIVYLTLGNYLQQHGNAASRDMFKKALLCFSSSAELDNTYLSAPNNSLTALVSLVPDIQKEEELQGVLKQADRYFAACTEINNKEQQCYNNYFQIYARAAQRTLLAGQNPQPRLQRALQHLEMTHQLGSKMIDSEQHAAMMHLLQTRDLLRRKFSPAAPLAQLDAVLADCFALAPEDVMCRTLAAQALWVRADWQAAQQLPFGQTLTAALVKARLAVGSPEVSPDAWQTLAETQLRIAQSTQAGKARTLHINEGLAALQKLFSINPNHALGLITQGQLLLLRAQGEQVPSQKRQLAADAAASLERGLQRDPFLRPAFSAVLAEAQALVLRGAPQPPSR